VKTFVTLGKSESPIEVEIDAKGRILINGVEKHTEWITTPDGVNLLVDGRVIDVAVDRAFPEVTVGARGVRTTARIESERERALSTGGGKRNSSGDKVIRAPMPGRIVRLSVVAGAEVTHGSAIAVVEAMKMENEVVAKAAGIVHKVHVEVGDTVEGNAPLVTFA
jgi:biotin carboxyl carrier protein